MNIELEENSQGYVRVKLPSGQYLTDVDLMSMCAGSHRSQIMTYTSKALALAGYAEYLKKKEAVSIMGSGKKYRPEILEDFKPIS